MRFFLSFLPVQQPRVCSGRCNGVYKVCVFVLVQQAGSVYSAVCDVSSACVSYELSLLLMK